MVNLSDGVDLSRLFGQPVANRTVRNEILGRLRRQSGGSSTSVTNLVFPRQAYYRAKFPDVGIPLERRESMIAGTAFHKEFLDRVGREATVEQYLEWERVVGRVDLYELLPLEVKRTDTAILAEDIQRVRPSYLEQLGIYCGMAAKDKGYLLVYIGSGDPLFVGADVSYGLLSGIRREIIRRRDAFQTALANDDPSALPACPFAGTTCVWFEQGICRCDPEEPASFPIAGLAQVSPNEALSREFTRRYEASLARPVRDSSLWVNDLIRPRYACLRRLPGAEEDEEVNVSDEIRSADGYAFYKEFRSQCFRGSDYKLERREHNGVRDWVAFHDGRVTVFTRCGFVEPVKRYLLPRVLPEPFLRLGFSCVLANRGRARLVIWYPNVAAEEERILVYDVTAGDLGALRNEMNSRIEALLRAVDSGDASGLPKCEAWRARWCEYAPGCGCGPLAES